MAKKLFQSHKAASKSRRILIGLFGLLLVGVIASGLFLSTLDVETFRGKIEQTVQEKTGRAVKLSGPIGWGFSITHGINLSLADVTIANPSWASRPDMARIGSAKLHLAFLPLLDKKIDILAFELGDTDVLLETSSRGAANWDFTGTTPAQDQEKATPPAEGTLAKPASPVQVNVREVSVTQSRVGIKDANGKTSVFEIPDLQLKATDKDMNLHFKGNLAGHAVDFDVNGGPLASFFEKNWPFTLQAVVDTLKLESTGTLSDRGKTASLEKITIESGESKIDGALTVTLGGARPMLRGEITSPHLDLADFTLGGDAAQEAPDTQAKADKAGPAHDKIFSREPLPLAGLKTADLDVNIALEHVVLGLTALESVKSRLVLTAGKLTLQPLTARIAGSMAEIGLTLDASAPTAHLTTSLKANDLDMSQLFKMGGMESFLSGKSHIDISLSSYGQSSYDLAAHANGTIDALMDRGEVSQSIMSDVAGGLLQVFAPGVGSLSNPSVNCMAARYVITNGLMDTKGLLIDTEMTTIAGKGSLNLPEETLGMSLFTQPKGLGLGTMIPPMQVAGTLTKPSFALDAAGAVQKITGLLTGGKMGTANESGVPTLVQVAGKNTCAATLDAPQTAAPTTTTPLLPDSAKNAADVVKETGSKLLKGLFGK